MEPMKLELGCGHRKLPGWIGIDYCTNSVADIIADVERRLPFKDDSIDEVRALQVLEHVTDLDSVMLEIHRVCRNGARVHVEVPSFWSSTAAGNPHHKRFFTRDTFCAYDGREDFPRLFKVLKRPSILHDIPLLREFHLHTLKFDLEVVK